MNWLSALKGAEAPSLEGTVREHICADDFNQERALRIAALRAKARDKIRATIAKNKASGRGSGWAKGLELAPRIPCQQCGKPFYAPPSYLKRGQGKYCGRKCWGQSLRKE